jgi:ABC-type dipeptide/oligopeptide/nickel transport system permease component
MVPTLVGITLLTYAIVRLAPGDPVGAMIRAQAGNVNPRVFEQEADQIRERLGLKDHNLWGDSVPDQIARLADGKTDAVDELVRITDARPGRLPGIWDRWWTGRHPETLLGRLDEMHAVRSQAAEQLTALTDEDFGPDPEAWAAWWDTDEDAFEASVGEKIEEALDRLERARKILTAPRSKEADPEEVKAATEAAEKDLDEAHQTLRRLTEADLPADASRWRAWWRTNRPSRLIERMAEAEASARTAADGLARWAGEDLGIDPEPWHTWWETYRPTFQEEHEAPFKAALERLRTAHERYVELQKQRLQQQAAQQQEEARRQEEETQGAKEVEAKPDADADALDAELRDARRARADAADALVRVTGTDLGRSPEGWQLWWEANRYRIRDEFVDTGERIVSAFIGYGQWVWHMAHGDFGESMQKRTAEGSKDPFDLYVERADVTLVLNLIAQTFIFLIAIPVGLMGARYSGRLFDRGSTVVLLGLWSVPQVLAGTLLLSLLARGGIGWEWFPVRGLHSDGSELMGPFQWFIDTLWHATLPVACLVYGGLAYLAKLGRASLLENLRADYVRTARAKGLPERRVVYHHALRNSLLPMITTMVMMLPVLLGGSVVVERIFTLPGMGDLLVDAATQRDLQVIMFGTLVYGTLTLLSLLLADVLYAWADPRIRYD